MNKQIKCVVFDLDNTIWNGTVLEGSEVELIEDIEKILVELDNRGILMSIASKGEEEISFSKLKQFSIFKYFLYPQINWESKKNSIKSIGELLNIGIDTMAFVDDQQYELEEVSFFLPQVMCIESKQLNDILNSPRLINNYKTEEAKRRREFYIADIEYKKDRNEFEIKEEFFKQLNTEIIIRDIKESDLDRVMELVNRTSRLNSTGVRYSYEELKKIYEDNNNTFIMIDFKDKYCSYGTIGILLIEKFFPKWHIKLVIFSCRIITRDICRNIINIIVAKAKEKNAILSAEFIDTGNNKLLNIMIKSCGFEFLEQREEKTLFINEYKNVDMVPDYITVINEMLE